MRIVVDLIHIQFQEKKQAEHINYVAESFKNVVIDVNMLLQIQICYLGNFRPENYFLLGWK